MTTATLDLPVLLPVDPPGSLPVAHLSVSSLNLAERCPEAWKRRYIDKEPDRPNGKMLLGGAAGAALTQHFGRVIEEGEGLSIEELLDEYSSEWADRTGREEVEWGDDQPGPMKDSGIGALRVYHTFIAPDIEPVSVEREFELSWPGAPFTLTGFLDLETAEGKVADYKMTAQRWSPDKAAAELQPTTYLAARRAEGNPAIGFDYHTLLRTKTPNAEIVPTERTERQLDLLTNRVFSTAREIEWRWLNDCWRGTPPDLAWMCRSCPHHDCAWRRG